MPIDLNDFVEKHMRQSGRYVPARLQAALALFERLRDSPALRLDTHKTPGSTGLMSHETFGKRAHERLKLEVLNKNHGRRSCNVGDWGQELLDILDAAGFGDQNQLGQTRIIDECQARLAECIKSILAEDPLQARPKGRTVESLVRDILEQAEAKGKAGDVAQYLVAAKLMLRLRRDIPVIASNLGDRRSRTDASARSGDFEIEDATIEVAVGLPDEKHLTQVAEALEDNELEVWLLTRYDRVSSWQHEIEDFIGPDCKRVVVMAVETFVGQNVSEIAGFSSKQKAITLKELFALYNDRWVAVLGPPGIRIELK